MNIAKLFKSVFSEKRLLKLNVSSTPSGAPSKAPKQRINTPQKLEEAKKHLRGESIRQRQQIEATRAIKNPKEAAVDKYLNKLDKKKFNEMMRSGSVMVDVANKKEAEHISAFSSEQVEKVVKFAAETPALLNTFVAQLATKITTGKIGIDQLTVNSVETLLRALHDKAPTMKNLLDKLLTTKASADLTIRTAKEKFNSNKSLIENLIRVMETKEGLLKKLSATSLATLLNLVGLKDKRVFEKLDTKKKSLLLFTQLKPELKTNIFDSLIIGQLKEYDGTTLENLVLFAYQNEKRTKTLINTLKKQPEAIGKMGIAGCIKLLVETFPKEKEDKGFKKLLLSHISGANKLSIYRILSQSDILLATIVFNSFDANMRQTTTKKNQETLTKEKREFLKKCANKDPLKCAENKIKSVEEFEIRGNRIRFTIKGVKRNFIKSERFLRKLAKREYDSPLKIKLAVYKELLRIIKADGSIRSNKHRLRGDWKGSNSELQANIKKYEEIIATLDKGKIPPTQQTLSATIPAAPTPATPTAPTTQQTAPTSATPTSTPTTQAKKPKEKLTPLQIHKKILEALKKQGIKIILPNKQKLQNLKAIANYDGLQKPVFDIQQAVIEATNTEKLTKTLEEKGKTIKKYFSDILHLTGVKLEITIKVEKEKDGKKTSIKKTITWDQSSAINGGFGTIDESWLLGKKGKTVEPPVPLSEGEPKKTATTSRTTSATTATVAASTPATPTTTPPTTSATTPAASATTPSTAPTTAPTAVATKSKEYTNEAELQNKTLKAFNKILKEIKTTIDKKYPNTCGSLTLEKSNSIKNGYLLHINGVDTKLLIAITSTEKAGKLTPFIVIRNTNIQGGDIFTNPNQAKDKLAQRIKTLLALGHKSFETKEAASSSMKKNIEERGNKASATLAAPLEKALGIKSAQSFTLQKTSETNYRILVDGKKSNYTVHLSIVQNKFRKGFVIPAFTISGPGIDKAFENNSTKEVQTALIKVLKSVPNETTLNDEAQKKAINKLKKEGLKFILPKETKIPRLSIATYSVLSDSLRKVKSSVVQGTNVFEIIKNLKKIGKRLRKLDLPSTIKLQFAIETGKEKSETITWNPNAETAGFGNTLRLTINKLKEAQYANAPEKLATYKRQSRMRETEIYTVGSHESRMNFEMKDWSNAVENGYYKVNDSIADLSDENIENFWERFTGYREVNSILGQPPFKVPARLQAKIGAKIIAGEGILNRNAYADFEDIFTFINKYNGGFKGVPRNVIEPAILKDAKTFLTKLKELKTKNPKYYEVLIEKVLKPCLLLLRAMTQLRYKEKKEELYFKDPISVALKSYPSSQHHIIKGLQSLLGYKEHRQGAWKAALAWLSGGKRRDARIYLSDMHGKVRKIDEGMFQRYFNPRAALFMLLEQKGLYKIDPKTNEKRINEQAMLEEINKMLKNGYLQLALRKFNRKGKKPTKKDIDSALRKIKANLANYQITSLADLQKLGGKHKLAFQLGFIHAQVEKIEMEQQKGLDARIDAAFEVQGKDPSKIKDGERAVMRHLLQKGLKANLVPEVYEGIQKSIGSAGIMFDSKGKFLGVGAGKGIRLSDGSTLIFAAAFSGKPPFVHAQIGINITVHQSNGTRIGFNSSVGISGVHAAFEGSHAVGKDVNFNWLAGVGFSWSNLAAGATVGVGLDWSKAIMKTERQRAMKRTAEKAGWNIKTLKEWKSYNAKQKMDILHSLPQWMLIKGLMEQYPNHFTKKNLIKVYDRYFSSLNATALHKAAEGASSIPLIPTGIKVGLAPIATGLALGGPVGAALAVLGGIKFRLGTIVMFIPSPGTTEKVMSLASSARVDAKVKAKLKKLAAQLTNLKYTPVEFSEESGTVYRRPGSKLGKGVRMGEAQIVNLSGLSRFALSKATKRNLETYNKALKAAEVKLVKHSNGKIELQIQNLYNKEGVADKDLEIHIDPTLQKLGVVMENGKIFLEGNIDDLIITRERFMFAAQRGKGKSSIRDVITIRQRASFEGRIKANRDWIMSHEISFAEILMGSKKMKVKEGVGGVGVPNLRDENYPPQAKEKWLARLRKARTEAFAERQKSGPSFSPAEMKGIKRDVDTMYKALQIRTNKEWKGMTLRKNFYEEIRALYNNKEFFKKFREITDNPDKIYKLLKEFENNNTIKPKFNERERTTAENYLRNLWFVTVYRSYGSLKRLRKSAQGKKAGLTLAITRKLWEAGLYNMRTIDHLSADEIVKKSKDKITPAEAKIVVNAMKAYKERPLTNDQLIYRNKLILRNLLRFKKWTEKKYLSDFRSTIGKLWKTEPKPNAEKLVKAMMEGMYGDLIKKLKSKTPPIFDFRKVPLVEIPQGATLISGSRTEKGRKRKEYRAFTSTLSYETTAPDKVQIHGFGFLRGTIKEYSLTKGSEQDKQIARILLEIAHPLPEKREDIVKSAFALQVLSLASYRLIAGAENYKAMIEIVKNPTLANSNDKKYKTAMDQFVKLLKKIRLAQHSGKPYTHPEKIKGVTITIDMATSTVIKAGAFSKCTNASFFVNMRAKARLSAKLKKAGKKSLVIGDFVSTRQHLKSIVGRDEIGFSLFGGVYHKFEKSHHQGEKVSSHGSGETPPEGEKASGTGSAHTGVDGQHSPTSGPGHAGEGRTQH